MKFKINKYQNGGTTNPPFVYYKPVEAPQQESQQAAPPVEKESKGDSGELTDKQLFDMVKDINGLPSDMSDVMQRLNAFYSRKNLFGGNNKINSDSLSTQYLQTLLQIKSVNFNKDEYKDAKELVTSNEALNDIAIGRGNMLTVLDKDHQLKFVTVKDFLNSSGEYRAITNSDLLRIRSLDTNYANNNEILGVVKNGIGISKVTKMIQDALSGINSTQFKREGYASSDGQKIIKGAQALDALKQDPSGMAVPGTYKYSKTYKDNASEIKAAIHYIASTLPENAMTLLQLHSGNKNNPEQGALDLIVQLASARAETNDAQDMSLIANYDSEGNSTKGNGNKAKSMYDLLKTNQGMAIQTGQGGSDAIYQFEPKDSNASLSIRGQQYSAIKDKNHKVITDASYKDLLAKSDLGSITDTRSIIFGDQPLNPMALKDVMYANTGLTRALLPSKLDNYGNKVPDFTYFKRFEQANKEIQKISRRLTDDQRLKKQGEILTKYGLSNLTNRGVPDTRKFGLFLVGDALTTSKVIDKPSTNMDDVSSQDNLYDLLESTLYTNAQGKKTQELDRDGFINFGGYDHIYKAPIYIPIKTNVSSSFTDSNATWQQMQDLQQLYDNEDKRTHANLFGSANLFK